MEFNLVLLSYILFASCFLFQSQNANEVKNQDEFHHPLPSHVIHLSSPPPPPLSPQPQPTTHSTPSAHSHPPSVHPLPHLHSPIMPSKHENQDNLHIKRRILPSRLQHDIDDFFDLIPQDEIRNLTIYYFNNDAEVRFAYEYLASEEFTMQKERTLSLKEVKDFLNYLDSSGMHSMELLNKLGNLLGPPQFDTSSIKPLKPSQRIGGFNSLVESILNTLPQDEIFTLFFDTLGQSSHFSHFIGRIGSYECGYLFSRVVNSSEFLNLRSDLYDNGIDTNKIEQSVRSFFGFGSSY